jgi:hypothetical protein
LDRIATLKALVNNKTTEIIRDNKKANAPGVLRPADISKFLYREFIPVKFMSQISYHDCGMIGLFIITLTFLLLVQSYQ